MIKMIENAGLGLQWDKIHQLLQALQMRLQAVIMKTELQKYYRNITRILTFNNTI